MAMFDHIEWVGGVNGFLRLLDQRKLPGVEVYWDCKTTGDVFDAIQCLAVRGAPAIGIAAGYGCVIGAREMGLNEAANYLAGSRPTAVNLFWALNRMKGLGVADGERLLDEAKAIHREDVAMCDAIGEFALLEMRKVKEELGLNEDQALGVMTHCNAGTLATGGIGTATAGMYKAVEAGMKIKVYACETRPLLQGARLTSYELHKGGVDVTVMCDGMSSHAMREGKIHMVITGADRVAANGDSANKIGTLGHAIAAKHFGIPFYIAAPSSTFDFDAESGKDIPIELRDGQELVNCYKGVTVGEGIGFFNPAFDVTEAELIKGIITEKGMITDVSKAGVAAVLKI